MGERHTGQGPRGTIDALTDGILTVCLSDPFIVVGLYLMEFGSQVPKQCGPLLVAHLLSANHQ